MPGSSKVCDTSWRTDAAGDGRWTSGHVPLPSKSHAISTIAPAPGGAAASTANATLSPTRTSARAAPFAVASATGWIPSRSAAASGRRSTLVLRIEGVIRGRRRAHPRSIHATIASSAASCAPPKSMRRVVGTGRDRAGIDDAGNVLGVVEPPEAELVVE